MRLFILTFCLLSISISSFSQEIFGGINFGNSKKIIGNSISTQSAIVESEWDVLWKNKKRPLIYNGLNLKIGINYLEGYKIGLGYKSVFGLNYNEEYSKFNIGIESTLGISYQTSASFTPIDKNGFALEIGMGVRFRFFQNYTAKIMYNLSYPYFNQLEDFSISNGFSIGFAGPLWVNKKSIFKRRRALKLQKGEKW